MELKTCKKCDHTGPQKDFHRYKNKYANTCTTCQSEGRKAYRQKLPKTKPTNPGDTSHAI